VEIGNRCIDPNPVDRPDTLYVIGRLDEMEHTCGFIETDICASLETRTGKFNHGIYSTCSYGVASRL
jgi:hypothetical protein